MMDVFGWDKEKSKFWRTELDEAVAQLGLDFQGRGFVPAAFSQAILSAGEASLGPGAPICVVLPLEPTLQVTCSYKSYCNAKVCCSIAKLSLVPRLAWQSQNTLL